MMLASTFRLIVAAALAAACFAESMPTYWRLADPQAQVLIGLNWKALRESPMAAQWKAQMEQASGGFSLDALDEDGTLTDMLSRVDGIFVSAGEVPAGTKAKPKGTVALTGDFDLAVLRKFLARQGGSKSLYRGVEIWQNGKSADNVMIALVSPQVLAFGDKASVRSSVSHYAVGDGSIMGNSVFQRAASLAQANDIWIAGQVPEKSAAALTGPAAMLGSVESFDLGMRLRSGLDVQMNLYAADEQQAAALGTGLKALVQLAAADNSNPKLNEFLSRLEMGSEGDRIHFAASWTEAELAELSTVRLSGTQLAQAGGSAELPNSSLTNTRPFPPASRAPAASTQPAAPAKPKGPLKVRIYNPDDENVKELVLTQP